MLVRSFLCITLIIYIIFLLNYDVGAVKSSDNADPDDVCVDEMACADKLGFDAIMALHKILDDDANGAVDVSESDEFLREELQYEAGYERRHNAFHLNDKYISVKELWEAWKKSEVHNWTVEQTIEWLVASVELPQYIQTFQENGVDGTTLPRLAVNNMHFLTNILGIKDPIHKQKLALKAMDVVLFGPPKVGRNFFKDIILVTSLVIAVGGCWFAYLQHKYSQQHLKKMMKDMDSLQKAEAALTDLHVELDKAKQEQETAALEKKNLEQRLQDELSGSRIYDPKLCSLSPIDLDRLKFAEEELRHVRDELRRAEKQLEDHRWLPPPSLQHWLQLTHELELRSYNAKKSAAEGQLAGAKEGCEKLRKKRSSLMGAFRIAHGNSIDDVDSRILQAKAALTEVTQDLKERLHRWRTIENLCGFSIVNNPGLMYLQSILQGSTLNGTLSQGSLMSGSQDDLDDIETASTYAPTISADSDDYSSYRSLMPSSREEYLHQACRDSDEHISSHRSLMPSSRDEYFYQTIRDSDEHISSYRSLMPASRDEYQASKERCMAYNHNTWHGDHQPHAGTPVRGLPSNSDYEGGSHPNLSSLAPSLSLPGNSSGNGHLSPTVKRCRSAGAEAMEIMTRGTDFRSLLTTSNDNLQAVAEEDSGLSTTESNSIQSTQLDAERPVFLLGDSPSTENAIEQEVIGNVVLRQTTSSNSRFVKSYSHEHSSPPKEVPPHQHSSSEPTLDLQGNKKKKSLAVVPRSAVPAAVLDEENSTDSGSMVDEEVKKEKKKRFALPTLRRSHKTKTS